MNFATDCPIRVILCLICMALLGNLPASAQSSTAPAAASNSSDLDAKIRLLTESLEQTRTELSESRTEIHQLRALLQQELQKAGEPAGAVPGVGSASEQASGSPAGNSGPTQHEDAQSSAQIDQDDWQIVNAKLKELQQDKVVSRLKYRLKLSGMVLFQAFGESGQVDNFDVPVIAFPRGPGDPSGSLAISLRQSTIGLTAGTFGWMTPTNDYLAVRNQLSFGTRTDSSP